MHFVGLFFLQAPHCLILSLLMSLPFIWCWGIIQNLIGKVHCSNLCWNANCHGEVVVLLSVFRQIPEQYIEWNTTASLRFVSSSPLTICLNPHGPSCWQLRNLRYFEVVWGADSGTSLLTLSEIRITSCMVWDTESFLKWTNSCLVWDSGNVGK